MSIEHLAYKEEYYSIPRGTSIKGHAKKRKISRSAVSENIK
ncbi:MAG: hypothetical protein ACOC4M_14000 [Promethearchaeia archaeon]